MTALEGESRQLRGLRANFSCGYSRPHADAWGTRSVRPEADSNGMLRAH